MRLLAIINLLSIILAFPAKSIAIEDCWNQDQKVPLESSQKKSQPVDEFLKRWKNEKLAQLYQGALWSLTHNYSDHKEMENVLKIVQTYFEALEQYEKGEPSSLEQIGGIQSFKDKMANWLVADDQAIRAFAALMLGISGDRAYVPQLAKLLVRRAPKAEQPQYDKSRAALALGLLDAKEHAHNLLALLSSASKYNRIGAVQGLGWMRASMHAKAVARLLKDKDEGVREAALQSLEMMGATEMIKDAKKRERRRN
jgi:hypothetical protein